MRKKIASILCVLVLSLLSTMAIAAIQLPTAQKSLTVYIPPPQASLEPVTDSEWAPIPAQLNQRMATRSGPGTMYTEELGTVPKSTEITVLWQEDTGVLWGMVEFTYEGKPYRAYTGMKRIDTEYNVPELTRAKQKAVSVPDIRPYYGPGTQYQMLNHTLPAGTFVDICLMEKGYALIDYTHPTHYSQRVRSWVPVSALKNIQ